MFVLSKTSKNIIFFFFGKIFIFYNCILHGHVFEMYQAWWKAVECLGQVHENMVQTYSKVQVGKDQEKAQSEKDSHSKNRGGKKPN